jgi:hypothetical protein
MTTPHPLSKLIGTWSSLAWFNETKDGRTIHPLGKNPTGYISYSEDGFVFVHMASKSRELFGSTDPFGGTAAQDSAALKSHITYAGRYEFVSDTRVVHHAKQSSVPDWVGTQQVRDVIWIGDKLRLSAQNVVFQGQSVDAYVDWERATLPQT